MELKLELKLELDLEETLEALSDSARGRLLMAMLRYMRTGQEPKLSGSGRFVWPTVRQALRSMEEKREIRRRNGLKGGRPAAGQEDEKPASSPIRNRMKADPTKPEPNIPAPDPDQDPEMIQSQDPDILQDPDQDSSPVQHEYQDPEIRPEPERMPDQEPEFGHALPETPDEKHGPAARADGLTPRPAAAEPVPVAAGERDRAFPAASSAHPAKRTASWQPAFQGANVEELVAFCRRQAELCREREAADGRISGPDSPGGEPALRDEALAEQHNREALIKRAEEIFGRLTDGHRRLLSQAVDRMGLGMISYAMEVANDHGARTFKYLERMLQNYQAQGITTPQEAMRQSQARTEATVPVS